MSAARWRELSVVLPEQTAPGTVEALFALFDEIGAPGSVLFDDPHRVTAYLPDDVRADEAAVQAQRRLTSLGLVLSARVIEETDWSEAWKAFFRPRRIGQRLVVCPSWERADAGPDDIVLDLDPGQAFGTGDHPTTKMCLELLERHLRPGDRVLDVGAGSGILSIAALKLGAYRTVCCDVDPVSVEAARANLMRNGCDDRAHVVLAEGVRWCRGTFDVCVSNIISATLVRLAADVGARLRPGGAWILSGICRDNEKGVTLACEEVGFTPVARREDGDWVALVAKR